MRIIVCVKQIPDPEVPPSKFKIDPEAKRVIPPEGIPPVMSLYDEQAVEAALRIKDKQECEVIAISLGSNTAEDVIRHALAMGADEGLLIGEEGIEGGDSFSTAYILSQTIKKIGKYDLILCGRQAADWDVGAVGPLIAENLGISAITFVKSVEPKNGNLLRAERVIEGGHEVIEVVTPAVVIVTTELGEPRIPSAWGTISAARKEIPKWTIQELELDSSLIGAGGARSELHKLYIPSHERNCEIVGGETVAEATAGLVVKLWEKGLI